jgi:isopenicillin-N epimerase
MTSYAAAMPVQVAADSRLVRPAPIAPGIQSHWRLDPEVVFLNHGCFGSTPIPVLEAQARLRDRIEARPIELLGRRCREMLDEARAVIGPFIGAEPRDFAFVANATGGINAVLRSLAFKPGDELLTTTHVYNAVRQAMRFVASRAGAKAIELPLPPPWCDPPQIVDAIAAAITPRTRLLIIDHIASPTSLLFPVKEIIDLAAARGIDTLVDGAHAPGMVDLQIESLAPAYYAGNLHKWACGPKGSAFLWVRRDRQAAVHPETISHFLDQGFQTEFDWQGTRDITAWVGAADAIRFMAGLGWPRVMAHNHALATWMQAMLCERWRVEPATPLNGSMIGSMATVPLPERVRQLGHASFEQFLAVIYDR